MSGYTKLFSSILESTVWLETPPVKVVWITLLAMADRDGCVQASLPGLAKRAGVERGQCEQALALFLAPDPDSRTTSNEGRRIVAVDGGWRLLNYETYRERASAEESRTKAAERQRRYRERHGKSLSVTGVTVTPSNDIADPSSSASSPSGKEKERASVSVTPEAQKDERRDPFTDETVTARAGEFCKLYQTLYPLHRKGARYTMRPARDYAAAVTLCETWTDDSRLEKLAKIFLMTDHDFAESGSRTIPQFLALASWCDGRLAESEAKTNGGVR